QNRARRRGDQAGHGAKAAAPGGVLDGVHGRAVADEQHGHPGRRGVGGGVGHGGSIRARRRRRPWRRWLATGGASPGRRRRGERFDVRRALLVSPKPGDEGEFVARADTEDRLAPGADAYELGADRLELTRAARGPATASPLFIGHDGLPYKRGYAAVRDGDRVA